MTWANTFQISHAHAVHCIALHSKHTNAELSGNQFTNQANSAVAQCVNVVSWLLRIVQANNFTQNRHQIAHLQCTIFCCICNIQTQALVQFITTNPRIIEPLEVKEHSLNHLTSIINCRQIAWTQSTINLNQRLVRTTRSILVQSFVNVFYIASINISKQFLNFASLWIAQSAQQSRCWHLAAAVNLYVNRAIRSRLKFHPSSTSWNDFCAVVITSRYCFSSEENTSRANQLANNHALRTVDNKRTALSHPWIFTEVNFLLFDHASCFICQFNRCVQWSFKCQVIFLGKLVSVFWLAKIVFAEL